MIYFDKDLMVFQSEKPIEKENLYEITEEEFNDIQNKIMSGNYELKVDENGRPYTEYSIKLAKEELRIKREPLLKAYDTYKIAYIYGDIIVSDEEKLNIKTWYQGVLNLEEEYINNIPNKIKYFL